MRPGTAVLGFARTGRAHQGHPDQPRDNGGRVHPAGTRAQPRFSKRGARIIAGVSVCAVLPTALVYIGDVIPFNRRHAVIADVLATVAIGTAADSLGGGLFAYYLNWRLIFAVTAVVAAALADVMGRLPESDMRPSTGSPFAQLR